MRWPRLFRLVRGAAIPLVVKIALWGSVGLVLGGTALVHLLASVLCINAVYRMFAVATSRPVRLRNAAAPEVLGAARRRAWVLEGASLLASVLALLLIGAFYAASNGHDLAALLWVMGWGLPARCNGPLKSGVRRFLPRVLRVGVGVALVGMVLLVQPSVFNVALALVAREWVASLVMALIPLRWSLAVEEEVRTDVPDWGEFLAQTAALSMRRFFYQAGRSLLHLTLGPLGMVVARIARGSGVLKRADSFAQARTLAALAAVFGLAGTVAAARLVSGPAGLAASVLMLKLTCAGAGAIMWSLLAPRLPAADLDPDDEDLD